MSDPGKRIHTLLTDGAVSGLSAHEREELASLLGGEPIDPSYEHAAVAIELGLHGHAEPLPSTLEATIIDQADRYWGFAELRPREPTLGGAGGELLLSADLEATPIHRIWERSPDNLDDLVLESSLTNGRLDRIGPGESLRGEILTATDDPLEGDELERDDDRATEFDSEVDAKLDALELEDDDDDEPGEAVVPRPRRRSRSEPRSEAEQPEPAPLILAPPDYRIARWATYVSAIAALAILAVALWVYSKRNDPVDPEQIAAEIESSADKLEWSFAAKPDPLVGANAGGSIVWSSDLQAGVMVLRGLAANDPTTEQYQLWIVDRRREGPPVDGGVFDVPVGDELRIPVDAKLLVGDPAVFTITVERPGGVVVSRQDRVVMVAAGS
jgi:anti-sigma-K factor RskA